MAGNFPDNLRYTKTDEWVRGEGDECVVGITGFASEQLGDVVYVELPAVGSHFGAGDSYGEIESVKAVSDLYCPLAGTVTAINEALDQSPSTVNDDPYGEGWMVRLKLDNPADHDSLLDATAYEQTTAERA